MYTHKTRRSTEAAPPQRKLVVRFLNTNADPALTAYCRIGSTSACALLRSCSDRLSGVKAGHRPAAAAHSAQGRCQRSCPAPAPGQSLQAKLDSFRAGRGRAAAARSALGRCCCGFPEPAPALHPPVRPQGRRRPRAPPSPPARSPALSTSGGTEMTMLHSMRLQKPASTRRAEYCILVGWSVSLPIRQKRP